MFSWRNKLAEAIVLLAREISISSEQRKEELNFWRSEFKAATKKDLQEMEKRIMSAISDFAAKQQAHNDRVDTAVTGIQTDVTTLKELVEKLQNTQGQITPEDQALLDQIEQRSAAIADKLEALDALTPPPAPPANA